ncbi:hypothetical protein GCM10011416_13680 [Polaribacter pacificus]|uniref:DUF1684 domain-containing protein n=1 Tax=Polaribacter pacificus TaxID=1775173 RepID=A0A917HYS1_9FLAO|nr:DUF1684 domain-containing protein [Polaribacter pacificus]GGG97011.1 hypothetical protein GCM10011416_13680 [Polaribacter pacificus]
MKNILLICLFFLFLSCNSGKKKSSLGLTEFQIELNNEYKDASKSPLKKADLKNFTGLEFFPINENVKVTAHLERVPDSDFFFMKTTTDRLAEERVYGILTFKIEGKEYKLNIYQGKQLMRTKGFQNYLFLPFTDKTNGVSSYYGGRYMDLRIPEGDSIELDFNKAYNPYCAYNEKFSCPIVPKENHLDYEMKAGVMAFKKG